MTDEPLADVREMYMSHTALRREFGLVASLVHGVAAGDVDRAHMVADHIALVGRVLEHHHRGEDKHLWPRLLQRAPAELMPAVCLMEQQHDHIEKHTAEIKTLLSTWRETADPRRGSELAEALGHFSTLLDVHLQAEEQRVVPQIAKHITAAEWNAMVAEAGADSDPAEMPLVFGMMMYEGDPEVIELGIAQMPDRIRPIIRDLATRAFAEHSLRIHGTSTPRRGRR